MCERNVAASKENREARFFTTLAEPGRCFMFIMDIIMRDETSQKRYYDNYVIVYTNSRIVQGQARLLSTNKVDMLHRTRFQGAYSTHYMLFLIKKIITK